MKNLFIPLLAAMVSLPLYSGEPSSVRPVHTYSIVARDSVTGDVGVAVQSHWFSVGSRVAWAEAGVGAVATLSPVSNPGNPGAFLTALLAADAADWTSEGLAGRHLPFSAIEVPALAVPGAVVMLDLWVYVP